MVVNCWFPLKVESSFTSTSRRILLHGICRCTSSTVACTSQVQNLVLSYSSGSVGCVMYLCLLVTCVLCHCHTCLSWHRVMATTVSVIQAGLVKTVIMTSMNVIRTLVATLARVWTPSMGSIVSVHRVLQVWTTFMWWFKLIVLEIRGFKSSEM
jgi:hypothetical protein